ncbi:MAG: hypothetical protein P8Y97_10065 [Candidatus Lokiarchaeota archaeon]
MDFYIFPDSDLGKKLGLDNFDKNESKGIRISYHFEPGMKEPDVKIDSDIDKDKINEYMKRINLKNRPDLRKFIQSRSKSTKKPKKNFIDAEELSLDNNQGKEPLKEREPLTEVHDYADYTEIILEVPGVNKEDIEIRFQNDGKTFKFCGKSESCEFVKVIPLTFKVRDPEYSVELNNGIAVIKIK